MKRAPPDGNVLIGRRPMARVGRAVEKGESQGFMKELVDADSKEILGATNFGTGGDEVIHCVLRVRRIRSCKEPCTSIPQSLN
jgi:pyruvate/2-oxoglutarate dehydrogenase complex dihydrolipoamide dehydrogenase (E3) component